jgi:DivIVA domain-containing protein
MALTLDTIVNKVFTTAAGGGYDRNEVDDFLDEILEEMENREKETESLKQQIADLNERLSEAKSQLADAQSAAENAANARPVQEDIHSTESFELVMNKARSIYDDIVSEAKNKAEGIINSANSEAVNMRTAAQKQITDLSDRLASLRRQTADYYDQLSKVIEKQTDSMSDLKRLL